MKSSRAMKQDPLERLVVDELIAILESKKTHFAKAQDNINLLEGLEELLSHTAKGLKEVKAKHLSHGAETKACRSYIRNLLGTLDCMSHTSHVAEMPALQSTLRDILNEMLTQLDTKHTKHPKRKR